MEFVVAFTAEIDITGQAPDNFRSILTLVLPCILLQLVHYMPIRIIAQLAMTLLKRMYPIMPKNIQPILEEVPLHPLFRNVSCFFFR
jgi:hypothetical protein